MAEITVDNVTLRYPIHNSASLSIKQRVAAHLGGRLAHHSKALYVEALNGVSCRVEKGQRLGVIGKNGAGKSTLLKVVAGVYPPTKGTVSVTGKITPFTDINLGMDHEATGRENIIYRMIFMGRTFREAHDMVDQIVEYSELGSLIDMPVHTYSQGMFMRLAFAISTSVNPEIMIMDEMIGVGDRHFMEKANRKIQTLVDNASILMIASHNREIIKQFCTHAVWLENGHVKNFGEVAPVLAAYDLSP